jgi:hypothetical protein
MMEEKQLNQAKAAYKSLCEMLDDNGWRYDKDEQELAISCSAQGDDLPIDIYMKVDAARNLVLLYSQLPFTVEENRRTELAVAVSVANYGIVDGSFDYDFKNGKILFRLTSSYKESLVGKAMFEYMLFVSCNTIDHYNDKLLAVAKKDMSYEEIIQFMK